jgi:hypothetical protein
LFAIALVLAAMTSGCATGRPLSLSGGLLKEGRSFDAGKVLPRVAVIDFDFAAGEGAVIGRDYDNVRPIVWKGSPGAAMADLVAASLAERGIPVVRVAMAGHVPGGTLVTVRGRIDAFRVNAKRIHSVKVEFSAEAGLTVFAEGDAVPQAWNSGQLSSEVWLSEPFFVTPDGARDAVSSASVAVADEAVRRLMTLRGAFTPPAEPSAPAPGGAPSPG